MNYKISSRLTTQLAGSDVNLDSFPLSDLFILKEIEKTVDTFR